jgi:hypothetical protein
MPSRQPARRRRSCFRKRDGPSSLWMMARSESWLTVTSSAGVVSKYSYNYAYGYEILPNQSARVDGNRQHSRQKLFDVFKSSKAASQGQTWWAVESGEYGPAEDCLCWCDVVTRSPGLFPNRELSVALSGDLRNVLPPWHQADFAYDGRPLGNRSSIRNDDNSPTILVRTRNIAGQPVGIIHKGEASCLQDATGDPLTKNKTTATAFVLKVIHHLVGDGIRNQGAVRGKMDGDFSNRTCEQRCAGGIGQ